VNGFKNYSLTARPDSPFSNNVIRAPARKHLLHFRMSYEFTFLCVRGIWQYFRDIYCELDKFN